MEKVHFTSKIEQDLQTESLRQFEEIHTSVFYDTSGIVQELELCLGPPIDKLSAGGTLVLGLGTGSALASVYAGLVALLRARRAPLDRVHFFQLGEFCGLDVGHLQSRTRFLREHVLDELSPPASSVHFFAASAPDLPSQRQSFALVDEALRALGGFDLVFGAFSPHALEFASDAAAFARGVVDLDYPQRRREAAGFFGLERVPYRAFAFGLGDTLQARLGLWLLALGEGAAAGVQDAVEGGHQDDGRSGDLQKKKDAKKAGKGGDVVRELRGGARVRLLCDEAAGEALTRFARPWRLRALAMRFDDELERKAVVWLALHGALKPILRLTEEDYLGHGLAPLLRQRGAAYDINVRVFRHMQGTLTGWPGGKSGGPTVGRVRAFPKRVLVFSPHPDDDVISMGGTFQRLADQGHELHVCYQTSGNYAVFDDDALRFAHFARMLAERLDLGEEAARKLGALEQRMEDFFAHKSKGHVDSREVLQVKSLIRNQEAWSAARFCGLPNKRIHFLEMPFYETGKVKKGALGADDIRMVADLIRQVRPHQIYAAGDLTDPHGTHRTCLLAIYRALDDLLEHDKPDMGEWLRTQCEMWLYRGAWQEWEPERITMAVAMAPSEVYRKRLAIFRHQSQKDPAPFPGNDPREFWQRTEARNRATAEIYDKLGFTEYEAIEAFVAIDIETKKFKS